MNRRSARVRALMCIVHGIRSDLANGAAYWCTDEDGSELSELDTARVEKEGLLLLDELEGFAGTRQSRMMVAALFVQSRGVYFGLPDVDPWDEARDARTYDGPHPVVAHPPCSRWCRLAGLVEKRWGHKKGEDGGCFASALASVRKWGGVLEHPAYSDAWAAHDLNPPPVGGGWVNADFLGGWTCYVEQHRYGHPAKKATWLYACRVPLASLEWGLQCDRAGTSLVSWCGNHVASGESRPRLTKRQASSSPLAFRDAMLSIARSVA